MSCEIDRKSDDIPSRMINQKGRNNDTENFAENLEVASRTYVNVTDEVSFIARVNALLR